ncbi:hypothetical protein ACJIZ3_024506 [Penstemon smallii]|uniref:Uncharacterized protein n=1 Tax=Penstemon smallii TaxID=265156 RepID=A0ABD3TS93_9LAMI
MISYSELWQHKLKTMKKHRLIDEQEMT